MEKRIIILGIATTIILIICSIFFFKSLDEREKPFKIGAILPLTGKNANYGAWIKNGLELAKDEINQKGGVNGRPIEILYEDDQADSKLAVNAVEKIIRDKNIPIIFGPWASSCALAIAPIAEKNKIPVLAEAQSPQIRDAGDFIFRIQPDSRYYLKYLAPFAYDSLKLRKVAILYVNNDYGVDQAKAFRELYKKLGGEIIYEEGFAQNNIDFKTQLFKIKTLSPDGVFIPAYVEAGHILKQSKEINFITQFIGSAPMENPEIITIAGDASNNVVYPHHFNPETNDIITKEFMFDYEKKYKSKVEGFSALAYDGLFIIKIALEDCGNDKECLKNKLYEINYNGVTGNSSFDDHGDVIKQITIRKIINKEFRTVMTYDVQSQ